MPVRRPVVVMSMVWPWASEALIFSFISQLYGYLYVPA